VTSEDDRDTDRIERASAATTRLLAAALRALASDVVDHDLPQQVALDLTEGVEALRAGVTGGRRRRYYETTPVEAAAAFADFSPISGRAHPLAIPMRMERTTGPDGSPGVRASTRFGHLHEGPPHGVHGGVIAAVFDELFGHAQQVHGVQALTASLTIRYKTVTPLEEDLVFFAQVVPSSRRIWEGRGSCVAGTSVTAEAEAVFVAVDLDAIARR
jgi:acyl-coenzyme A thioesterase PaaI-like protein